MSSTASAPRFVLLRGLRLVRRDASHLQLGVDPPHRAVLPDHVDVRRLLDDLVVGCSTGGLSPVAARALDALRDAGLVRDTGAEAAAAGALARSVLALEGPVDLLEPVRRLLEPATVVRPAAGASGGPTDVSAALVAAHGVVPRERVDRLIRDGVPHLVVSLGPTVTIGPFVVPGVTACLRCVDARLSEADPRRGLVVEQAARLPALGGEAEDRALTSLAAAWAARDLATFLEGGRPSTWSAWTALEPDLRLTRTEWRRHPYCGCSWGEAVAAG